MANEIDALLETAPDKGGEETPLAFKHRIKNQTCYSFLRGVMSFGLVLMILFSIVGAILCFKNGSEDNPLLFFAGLAVLFLGIIFSIAVHQAESLLVDIADTLIEQNRRKANTPKENP